MRRVFPNVDKDKDRILGESSGSQMDAAISFTPNLFGSLKVNSGPFSQIVCFVCAGVRAVISESCFIPKSTNHWIFASSFTDFITISKTVQQKIFLLTCMS